MIGVFDSGYGGLTILKSLQKSLPEYDFLYLGDNARSPYGNRSFETIYKYTLQAVQKMFDLGCPLVILACNTSSARALRNIQQKDLMNIAPNNRVLGVLRPCAEKIGNLSKSGQIGLFATYGTIRSGSYSIETKKFFPNHNIIPQDCPMLVPLVENNELQGKGTEYFVKKYVDSLMNKNSEIDTILLGCTHYPLLKKTFEKFLPNNVNIIEQGDIVANSLLDYLKRHPEMDERLTKNAKTIFYTSEETGDFENSAEKFYSAKFKAKHIEWD